MSYKLPPVDHHARAACGDMHELARMLKHPARLPNLGEATRIAEALMHPRGATRSVNIVVREYRTARIALYRFSGHPNATGVGHRIWTFGFDRPATREERPHKTSAVHVSPAGRDGTAGRVAVAYAYYHAPTRTHYWNAYGDDTEFYAEHEFSEFQ